MDALEMMEFQAKMESRHLLTTILSRSFHPNAHAKQTLAHKATLDPKVLLANLVQMEALDNPEVTDNQAHKDHLDLQDPLANQDLKDHQAILEVPPQKLDLKDLQVFLVPLDALDPQEPLANLEATVIQDLKDHQVQMELLANQEAMDLKDLKDLQETLVLQDLATTARRPVWRLAIKKFQQFLHHTQISFKLSDFQIFLFLLQFTFRISKFFSNFSFQNSKFFQRFKKVLIV